MDSRARRTLLQCAAWLGLALVVACKSPSGAAPLPEKPPNHRLRTASAATAPGEVFEPGSVGNGKALVAEFECNRCHAGTGLTAPKLDRDCVQCHEQIAT